METIDTLGNYEIRRVLGRGAMGIVYEGWDPTIERQVALKTVRIPDLSDDEMRDEFARFKREAQAAGRLVHPNIVGVYEYGETDEIAYIVMEYVGGPSLKSLLEKQGRLAVPEIVRIMQDLLEGLQYSHGRGVVHRDIKPANIMLTTGDRATGHAKIADFGIARIESSSMTQAGTIMGTPAYMSPEQLIGQTVDSRTDIYSCGVLLYQLLTGERPFEGGLTAIMHKALNTEPPPPSQISVGLPTAFDSVVRKAMAKRPADRYATAAEFAAALRAAATDGAVAEPTIIASRPGARRLDMSLPAAHAPAPEPAPAAGHLPLVAAGVVLLLAIGGGGAFLMLREASSPAVQTPPRAGLPNAATPGTPSLTPAAPPEQPSGALPGLVPQIAAPQAGAPQLAAPQPATPTTAPAPIPPLAAPPAMASSPVRPSPVLPSPFTPSPVMPSPFTPAPVAPHLGAPSLVMPSPTAVPPAPALPVSPPGLADSALGTPPAGAPPTIAAPASSPAVIASPTTAPAATGPAMTAPAPASQGTIGPDATSRVGEQLARVLASERCAMIDGDVHSSGDVVLTGLASAAALDELHGLAAGIPGIGNIEWHIGTADTRYCSALEVMQSIGPAATGHRRVGLGLSDGRTALHDGERIRPRIVAPDFAGFITLDYITNDSSAAHLYPQLADPKHRIVADPTVRLKPGDVLSLGEPMAGHPAWEVGEPYGTDLIIAIASSQGLFTVPRTANAEVAADYLRDLAAAVDAAKRAGVKLSGNALRVQVLPK